MTKYLSCASLIVLISLLVLPQAFAGTVRIHSGVHAIGEEFTVNEQAYRVSGQTIDDGNLTITKVGVKWDGGGAILSRGTCEDTNNIRVCFSQSHYVFDTQKKSYLSKAEITLDILTASLTLRKNIPSTTLLQGEEIRVESTLNNTGYQAATDIFFRDSYPGFSIKTTDCTRGISEITWKGELAKGSVKKCTSTLIAKEKGTRTIVAHAQFFDGRNTTNSSISQSQTITPFPLNVQVIPNVTRALVGKDILVTIIMNNTDPAEKAEIGRLDIETPESTKVIYRDFSFQLNGHTIKWTGSLKPGEGTTNTFVIQGELPGEVFLNKKLAATIKDVDVTLEEHIPFTLELSWPEISLSTNRRVLSPKDPLMISGSITNPEETTYRDVKIIARTTLPGATAEQVILKDFSTKKTVSLIKETIEAPSQPGVYWYNISVEYWYKTEKLFLEKDVNITIEGSEVVVETTASPQTEKLGEPTLQQTEGPLIQEDVDTMSQEEKKEDAPPAQPPFTMPSSKLGILIGLNAILLATILFIGSAILRRFRHQ